MRTNKLRNGIANAIAAVDLESAFLPFVSAASNEGCRVMPGSCGFLGYKVYQIMHMEHISGSEYA